jgi:hypothetical protein
MDVERAITILDKSIQRLRGRSLGQIEKAIISAAWHRTEYKKIDRYAEQTIKNRSSKLWQELSTIFGKNINKNNIKSILIDLDCEGKLSHKNIDNQFVVFLKIAGIDRS